MSLFEERFSAALGTSRRGVLRDAPVWLPIAEPHGPSGLPFGGRRDAKEAWCLDSLLRAGAANNYTSVDYERWRTGRDEPQHYASARDIIECFGGWAPALAAAQLSP